MKKIVLVTIASIVLIMISCKVTKSQNASHEAEDKGGHATTFNDAPDAGGPLLSNATPTQNPQAPQQPANPGPITHYDTASLDEEVRKEALVFGKDPSTYRRLVRKDADGTEIYRVLGMHIIKNPNGEEAFLPDEI